MPGVQIPPLPPTLFRGSSAIISTPRPSSGSTASPRLSIDHVDYGLAGVPEAVDEAMGVGSLDAGHGKAAGSVGKGDEAGEF